MTKRSNSPSGSATNVSGDESQSSGPLTRKRRRLVNASQLDLCQELFDKIRFYRTEDGSLLETFMKLPSRRSNACYYEAVREPIDLTRIQAKIKAGEYETVDQMAMDINLLIANTKSFYPVSTSEFAKAVELQDLFERERNALQNLTTRSTASTTSSSSSVVGRRTRSRTSKLEERDEEETESLSIATSDDSHVALSEASTSNQPNQLDSPYEMLFARIVKYIDQDGRSLALTFTYLPSKELYPVYYVVIKEPIDLRMIARRILSGSYTSMDQLEKEFLLLSRNAKTFNEPKSVVYQDAVTLAKILKGKRNEVEQQPIRSNRERAKRSSRLNYIPHDVVVEFSSLPDVNDTNDNSTQLDESLDGAFELSTGDEDEDTRATSTSLSCSSAASTPIKRGRGRPRKSEEGSRRSPSREPLSPSSTPSQFSTAAVSDVHSTSTGLPSTSATRAQRRLQEKLLRVVLEAKNAEEQPVSVPFFRLPSRRLYPDYYDEISNPLCLSEVKKRIKRYMYPTLETLLSDLDLIFANAQQYNVEQSVIHQDSLLLQEAAHKKYENLRTAQAALAIKPDTDTSDHLGTNVTTGIGGGFSQSDQTPIRRTGRRLMTPEEAIQKRLQNLYKTVYYYRAEDGHYPRDAFIKLPSKEDNPDYYTAIRDPIDLTTIKNKMDEGKYNSHQEMVCDLRLMFNNARECNPEGSNIYNDALSLDAVVKKRLKSLGPYINTSSGKHSNGLIHSSSIGQLPTELQYGSGHNSSQSVLLSAPGLQTTGQTSNVPLLQRVMLELFQSVRDYQFNGRVLSNVFMHLPSRSELPTYYEFIKKPVELQAVAKQLVQAKYTDFEEFAGELFLMFDNACKFNEPDSQIYLDALLLHRVCLAKRSMLYSTYEHQLSIPPAIAPDIGTGIRRMLTNLHNAMLTACDPDGRGLVDSLIAGDGTESTLTSVTAARLAALHRAVAAGAYRRLDRLQADWLGILMRARIGEGVDQPSEAKNPIPTRQQRSDATELARRWIRLRDDSCHRQNRRHSAVTGPDHGVETGSVLPNHLVLISTAMSYTEALFDQDLSMEEINHSLEAYDDESGEEVLSELPETEIELQQIDLRGQTYRVGDFVYVEPMRPSATQCHIGRIRRLSQPESEKSSKDNATNAERSVSSISSVFVRLSMYLRPNEAHPSRRRRLLAAEVFCTAVGETVTTNQIVGHCLVMPISHFIRFRPKHFDERDIFVCESQFSTKSKTFVKIRNWSIPSPIGVEYESRPAPFIPTRLPPNEPLENALEQVEADLFVQMTYPVTRTYKSIILEDLSETEGIQIYEQYVHENGFVLKLGDFLYVPSSVGSSEKSIVRVDKLWKCINQNSVLFSGPWFITSSSVDHLPTRLFYPKEVFLTSDDHATHTLASAVGKCYVMRPVDYAQARPTEIPEQDVYLCDSKYFRNEKVIRKLKKGLKKFQLSGDVCDDEIYFFSQAICPRKEASPLLAQSSTDQLSQEQLNRPMSTALACAVAAAAGLPSHHSNTTNIGTLVSTNTSAFKQSEHGVLTETFPLTGTLLSQESSLTGRLSNVTNTPILPLAQSLSGSQLDIATQAFIEANIDRTGKKRKLRKPPSGYVIFAGEVRKKLLQDRPEAPFGEISREVGLLWRQMPMSQRDLYERKAQLIRKHMEETDIQLKARERAHLQIHQQLTSNTTHTTDDKPHSVLTPVNPTNITIQPTGTVPTITVAGVNSPVIGASSAQMSMTAPAATMQFYQTPTGQVIQILHATSAPGTAAGTPQSGGSQTHSVPAPTIGQTSYATVPAIASACPVATGTHQVVYQLANQPAVSLTPASVTPSNSYYQQQIQHQQPRVLLATSVGSTPNAVAVVGSANSARLLQPGSTGHGQPAQIFLSSTPPTALISTVSQASLNQAPLHAGLTVATVGGAVPQPLTAQPQLTVHDFGSQVQTQYQLVQQLQPAQQPITPSALATVPLGVQATSFAQTQAPTIVTQSQLSRPPSPLFVTVPPRTSRVLHSEIYQRYINRLRKNTVGGLSDWHSQLSASSENASLMNQQTVNQLIGNFFSDPKRLSHYGHMMNDALWNLRDYILEDALKIRLRSMNSVECL